MIEKEQFSDLERKRNCYWYFVETYEVDWAYCDGEYYLLYGDWWYQGRLYQSPDEHDISFAVFFQHVDSPSHVAHRSTG